MATIPSRAPSLSMCTIHVPFKKKTAYVPLKKKIKNKHATASWSNFDSSTRGSRPSCRCTKVGVLFVPLYLCAGSRSHPPAATLGRAGETKAQDNQSNAKTRARGAKGQGGLSPWQEPCRGSLRSPGKNLAGATCPTLAKLPPLSLRVPTPSTTLEPRLGRCLHGGMQIFVKTKNIQD